MIKYQKIYKEQLKNGDIVLLDNLSYFKDYSLFVVKIINEKIFIREIARDNMYNDYNMKDYLEFIYLYDDEKEFKEIEKVQKNHTYNLYLLNENFIEDKIQEQLKYYNDEIERTKRKYKNLSTLYSFRLRKFKLKRII